jgi:hypothetical protein
MLENKLIQITAPVSYPLFGIHMLDIKIFSAPNLPYTYIKMPFISVADLDPGYGAFLPLDPGSGMNITDLIF